MPPRPVIVDRSVWSIDVILYSVVTMLFVSAFYRVGFAPGRFEDIATSAAVMASGFVLPCLYWRGYRVLGLMPVAVTLLGVPSVGAATMGWPTEDTHPFQVFGYGFVIGVAIRFCCRGMFASRSLRASRSPGPSKLQTVLGFSSALIIGVFGQLSRQNDLPLEHILRFALPVAWVCLIFFAWVRHFREFFELCLEPVYWLAYRIRGHGPGLAAIPYHGPLLIVANHAAWWDPVFLAKVLHRPITPMMTSAFFDIWFLRPLVKHVFHVVRVADVPYRRNAPEIDQAVRALDAGACVVIFPEGYLRRKEDVPLRRFGRGVWEILRQRPDTPVVACWIEGNWGSWVSYFNGPPTKNKRPDFRRRIDVAFSTPVTLPAETFGNHFSTRFALMNAVAAARTHLGLPPLPSFDRPELDEDPKQPA